MSHRECDPGDEMLGHGPGYGLDPTAYCQSGRECYILQWECGNTLCMLPAGAHCDDSLVCDPGGGPTSDMCFAPCYSKSLCGKHISCMPSVDGGSTTDDGREVVSDLSPPD
jgi:hypothetical protein